MAPDVRLMRQVNRLSGDRVIHPADVRIVLRALADHTALQGAVRWRTDEPDGKDPATAVSRWLHHVADRIWDEL